MPIHRYATGRPDLPIVGIATFARSDYVADWGTIDSIVAIVGAQVLGGLMEPADAVSQYLYLASDAARNPTGLTYLVDRGVVMA